jgi:hypothetical protein
VLAAGVATVAAATAVALVVTLTGSPRPNPAPVAGPAAASASSAGAPASGTGAAPSGTGATPSSTAAPSAPPTTVAPTPAGGAGVPPGYRLASGPNGLTVAIPAGWPVRPGPDLLQQADDPQQPGRFVRFGGSPAATGTELANVLAVERTLRASPGVRGYTRLVLRPVLYGNAVAAVEWGYQLTQGNQRRTAAARYWRFGGADYVILASAPAATWPATRQTFEIMLRSARPR